MTDIFNESSAKFTPDNKHRLYLYRRWKITRPSAMVIGLNPSKADAFDDDQTIGFVKRVLNFNGFGSFYMVNLYTMITPYPSELIADNNLDYNILLWKELSQQVDSVIFAWGSFKTDGREKIAEDLFPKALCFNHLKNGAPRHAMYLPQATTLKSYQLTKN